MWFSHGEEPHYNCVGNKDPWSLKSGLLVYQILKTPWAVLMKGCNLTNIGIPIIMIRWSNGCLSLQFDFHTRKEGIHIETGPGCMLTPGFPIQLWELQTNLMYAVEYSHNTSFYSEIHTRELWGCCTCHFKDRSNSFIIMFFGNHKLHWAVL